MLLAAVATMAADARGQEKKESGLEPSPTILVVRPAGGKAGTTVELGVIGQDIDAPTALLFSRPGLKAEPIGKGDGVTPSRTMMTAARRRSQKLDQQRFRVTIPAETPPGAIDVRLVNAGGVSNPRAFVVGDAPEVAEAEPDNDIDQAQAVPIGTVVDGTIEKPTDVDDYKFAGKAGERVVVSCLTTGLDSRLGAAIELYKLGGTSGRKLASGRGHGQDGDAVLDATLPADGDYLVRVHDYTYTQGGPDASYRLSITQASWIDAVVPNVVEPGKSARVTVFGRNLPGGTLDPSALLDGHPLERLETTVEAPAEADAREFGGLVPSKAAAVDGFEFRLKNEFGSSNPYRMTFATAPVVLDAGDNDHPDRSQAVPVPCEVAGRIDARGDRDWYAFDAKKGDVFSVEGFADRLGSPIDLYFAIRRAGGTASIAEYDDAPNTAVLSSPQFYARGDDPPRARFEAPADGRYLVLVSTREAPARGGVRDLYRLRIGPERPDFRLVVMPDAIDHPDSLTIRQGSTIGAVVFALRLDGYNGPIALSAEGLPEGISCPPQYLGPGQDIGRIVLEASKDAPRSEGLIRIVGKATIGGRELVHVARSATITWPVPQPGIPTLSRLDHALALAVRDTAPFRLAPEPATITMAPGDRKEVTLKLERLRPDFKAAVQVLAADLLTPNRNPAVVPTVGSIGPGQDSARVTLAFRPPPAPGSYSVIFRARVQVPGRPGAPPHILTLPAAPITVTIEPKSKSK
ncbi:MAG TPA: PPC domain-containing protein [Isosphaeraceae bacterium]|jgi:hypothetical protein|nr:PPC domain-containing protein [Isosphaeraceae bacterium]